MLCAAAAALSPPGAAAAREAPFSSTRFTVEVRGEGPDVILLPGLSAGRSVWDRLVRDVPGYRYHLVQVSGFAGDPARGNARGPVIRPLALELRRYIGEARLRRPAMIGHSMGGTLAMLLAAEHPRLLGRVMVVDMLPAPASLLGQSPDQASSIARGVAGLVETDGGRRLFSSLVELFAPPSSTFRTSDPSVVARTMNELAALDLADRLADIRVPLNIVYATPGPREGATVERSFRRAYETAREPTFVRIDRSGHMIMFDQPERLEEAVRAFLRR